MKIGEIIEKARSLPFIQIPADCPIDKVAEQLLENPQVRGIYVVDDQGRLLGEVSPGRIIRTVCAARKIPQFGPRRLLTGLTCETVEDILDEDVLYARKDQDLEEVIELMLNRNIKEIPIVDESHRIVANLGILELWCLAEKEWGCACPKD